MTPRRVSRDRFEAVRAVTTSLAAPLSAEDCAIQSMADASPVKWHLAHTTWFFETFVLEPHAPDYRAFHPAFRVLVNSYYNAIGARHPRPERGMLSRPGRDEISAYRRHVDAAMCALLERPLPDALAERVELGLHHEQQHQELIVTDLKHLFSRNPLKPAYLEGAAPVSTAAPEPHWIAFDGGMQQIGHAGDGFCFDNETPRHRVWLAPFAIASCPVTQGDFIAFIDDGGYRRPELRLAAGWDAVTAHGWQAPLYWEYRDGAWFTFTLHGEAPVDPHAPVCHVSFYEADAFARWAGARLPTGPSGKSPRATPRVRAISSSAVRCSRWRRARRRHPGRSRKHSATCGNGHGATTDLTRVFARRRAPSANTTASSCAASTCCAAARARHAPITSVSPTAISFRRRRAGSSRGCGWRAMLEPAGGCRPRAGAKT
jgi:ergothioneine biosynthesis protein EgtB